MTQGRAGLYPVVSVNMLSMMNVAKSTPSCSERVYLPKKRSL